MFVRLCVSGARSLFLPLSGRSLISSILKPDRCEQQQHVFSFWGDMKDKPPSERVGRWEYWDGTTQLNRFTLNSSQKTLRRSWLCWTIISLNIPWGCLEKLKRHQSPFQVSISSFMVHGDSVIHLHPKFRCTSLCINDESLRSVSCLFSFPDLPDAWSEVNTLRLAYSTPKVQQSLTHL